MKLSRRTFLRSAQATVALPMLECMLSRHGDALADGDPLPVRYAVWWFGNGVVYSKWLPAEVGKTWSLTPGLAPLAEVKNDVSVVSGFALKTPDYRGHHNGKAAIMSCAPIFPLPPNGAPYSSKFSRKSLDHYAATAIGGTTTFQTLQLGVSKKPLQNQGPTLQYLSHMGPDQPLPDNFDPLQLYDILFNMLPTANISDVKLRLRASVIDSVRSEYKRVQAKVSRADAVRLDAHADALSELRRKLLKVVTTCVAPSKPTQANVDTNGVEPIAAVNDAMSQLLGYAWACDLNRVATIHFSGSSGEQSFKQLSPNEPRDDEHNITHDPSQQNKVQDAVVFQMQNFAKFLQTLKSIPEPVGNVLDNSAILCATDVCEGLTHAYQNIPLLVAGKARGKLNAGIHFAAQGQPNISNVQLTLMQAIGTGMTAVGAQEGYSTTIVPELLV